MGWYGSFAGLHGRPLTGTRFFVTLALRNRRLVTGCFRCTADIQDVDATDSRGSASESRVSDLTAGKLTPKLSVRIADVHGRQLPTHN